MIPVFKEGGIKYTLVCPYCGREGMSDAFQPPPVPPMGEAERLRLLAEIQAALNSQGAPRAPWVPKPKPAPEPEPSVVEEQRAVQADLKRAWARVATLSIATMFREAGGLVLHLSPAQREALFPPQDIENSWLNPDTFDPEFDWRDDFDCTAACGD